MSIKIGIYEFFAYTIPGIVYLSAGVYFLCAFDKIQLSIQSWKDLPLAIYALLLLAAYILGLLMDPIAKGVWYNRFFVPKDKSRKDADTAEIVYDAMLDKFPEPKIHPRYWYSMLVYLYKENPELASSIDRFNASRIMLRNVSFALVVSAFVEFVWGLVMQDYLWAVASFALLLIFAVIAGKESAKYHRWFYQGILQAAFVSEVKIPDYLGVVEKETERPTTAAADSGFAARESERDLQSE